MESSNVLVVADDDQAEVEATAPAPAPLIMLEPVDESGVCTVDGWCN